MMQRIVSKKKTNNLLFTRKKKYNNIALGGTFDKFHRGHEYLINTALELSSHITIGITSEVLSRSLHQSVYLEPFYKRKQNVTKFLTKKNRDASIIRLSDIYGTTIKDESIEAVLVTKNTISGGTAINKRRKACGKQAIELITLDIISADDGKPISSTRIRNGEINRQGISFFNYLNNSLPLKIGDNNQHLFKKPFGKVFSGTQESSQKTMKQVLSWAKNNHLEPLITVGDVVTYSTLKLNGKPLLKIVDLHVRRKKRFESTTELGPIGHLKHYTVENKPGTISKQLIESINKALISKIISVIQVEGEEDLSVLPAVLLSPLNAVILYGHYEHGVIGVKVTEKKKEAALKIVKILNENNY